MTTRVVTESTPSEAPEAWQSEASTVRHRAAAFWLNVLFWTVRVMPWLPKLTLPFWVNMTWVCSPSLRQATLANARRLAPRGASPRARRRLARRTIANFYRFVCDAGAALHLTRQQLLDRIVAVEGREHFENALAQGRGVIVATAHLGSFEVGMASLADRPTPVHVVFQHDRQSGFERVRQALHEKIGVQEAPVDRGWDTWMKLRDALGRGEIVAIQADRVMPGQKGVPVPFCGGHVLLPLGPIKLARLVGSPIVPIYTVREGRGVRILIDPAIVVDPTNAGAPDDIPPALVELAASLERRIAAHPDQWLALHKAWQEDQASES